MTKLTRRNLLLTGAAAAGLASCGRPGEQVSSPLKAGAQPPTRGKGLFGEIFGYGVRQEANSLTADSDDVRMYREAVGWMKERSEKNVLDPMGWAQHWAHHSLFCATNTFTYQVHYGWYFLPWHRAYLVNLEQKIRRILNEPAFALPFWDWTRNNKIPDWFFGDDNPLNNTTRLQQPGARVPNDFIHPDGSLQAKRFDHFGGRERIPGELQVEGTMEQSIHNCVHNWIGGEMASFDGAGNDTIFQSHHGQIDRIWDIWLRQGGGRANPTTESWLEHPFWFYGWEGAPEPVKVKDLLDTKALGYDFADYDISPTLTEETMPVFDGDSIDFGVIDPNDELLAQINAVSNGAEGRVSLVYERLSLPMHPFHHRLFFIDEATGDATYVSTQTILPIPDLNRGLEREVSSQVQVPPHAVDAILNSGRIRVVGVPVPLEGRSIPLEPVPFKGVSLTVEA
ncbi:MAG: tyrosinase family protein [Pseudomonadota bacterium]